MEAATSQPTPVSAMTEPMPAVANRNTAPDERALVERARAGDSGAFEALYRRHVGRVYALCLRLAGDRHRAEDHVQEAFMKAWERLTEYRGEAAFATWLYRIAVNAALAGHRHDRRRGGHLRISAAERGEDPDQTLEQLPASGDSPAVWLDLERAIAALPDGARAVFVLHDIEGWQHEEIATLMGLAVGTSKAQLHRARRLLRERLES